MRHNRVNGGTAVDCSNRVPGWQRGDYAVSVDGVSCYALKQASSSLSRYLCCSRFFLAWDISPFLRRIHTSHPQRYAILICETGYSMLGSNRLSSSSV